MQNNSHLRYWAGVGKLLQLKRNSPTLVSYNSKTGVPSTTKIIFQHSYVSYFPSLKPRLCLNQLQASSLQHKNKLLLQSSVGFGSSKSEAKLHTRTPLCQPCSREGGLVQRKETDTVLCYKGPLLLLKAPTNGWVAVGCPPSSSVLMRSC